MVGVALLLLRPWERDPAEPTAATAVVTRVIDGDTFEALIDGTTEDVRLIGLDTPETVAPGRPAGCFGHRASRFSRRLLQGHRVRLRFGVERRDRYGRLLAYARLDGRLVNAILLHRGLARTLTIPPNDRLAPRFARIEREAARAGRGLWRAC